MPTEQEIQYHRSFLSLYMCRSIYNDSERYQHAPGGRPSYWESKIASDPVFEYHVRQCPKYPQRAPGAIDQQYDALLTRDSQTLDPLVIIPKRSQDFRNVAEPWERVNSVLCGSGSFYPVLNQMFEVTAHFAHLRETQLIYPKGTEFNNIAELIARGVPLLLWSNLQVYDPNKGRFSDPIEMATPSGWTTFAGRYHGGVHVIVLPNGKIVHAVGMDYAANNGVAIPTMSPLDFWAPGSRLAVSLFRSLTRRVGLTFKAGLGLLRGPAEELALFGASGGRTTLTGMGVAKIPIEHTARRTIIAGEDLAKIRANLANAAPQNGIYDVAIHGDYMGFHMYEKVGGQLVKRNLTVTEVAEIIGPRLAPGDEIRLLSCKVGTTGGPAQQLANKLGRKVWAADTAVPQRATVVGNSSRTTFVPRADGKFHQFVPERGAAVLGNGAKGTSNEVQGTIRKAR